MFVIWWGTKVSTRAVGYVADYCPLCRAILAFAVDEVRTVDHVYSVSIGSGQVAGYRSRCSRCGIELGLDTSIFRGFSQTSGKLEELIVDTQPDARKRYAERLELDGRIRNGTLSREEREALTAELLLLFEPVVRAREQLGKIGWRTALAFLGVFAFPALAALAMKAIVPSDAACIAAAGLGLAVGVALCIVISRRETSAWIRQHVLPKFAGALDSLAPRPEEIEQVLTALRRNRVEIAKRVREQDVVSAQRAVRTAARHVK